MANNIPLVITVSADGSIQAAANINNVAASAKKTADMADMMGKRLAAVFSVGAITAAAKSALQYAGSLQDMADQFGITASEAEGFIRQIRNVGGSSEKATSILQKLQAQQEKIGDTRSLGQYIDSIRESYAATGDFGEILEIVGSKNAAVFAAALREMDGGLEQFNDNVINRTSALVDYYTEQWEQMKDASSLGWSAAIVDAGTFFSATATGWGKLMQTMSFKDMAGGFAGVYAEQQKIIDQLEARRIESEKAVSEARKKEEEKRLYDYWQKSMLRNLPQEGSTFFMGPTSPFNEARGYSTKWAMDPRYTGPFQPTNKREGDYQLAPVMTAISSAAITALQKYKEGGSNSVEKQNLIENKRQTRYAKETAENTKRAPVTIQEISY